MFWNYTFYPLIMEKKEEILHSHMIKASIPSEKKIQIQHKDATKHFDCTTIAHRVKTFGWNNDCNATGVVEPVYNILIFPLTAKAV